MWLPLETWRLVQGSVPIVCVDLLPIRRTAGIGTLTHMGLIRRETPHQGRRWCLIGGRLQLDESLAECAHRQMRETLGANVSFTLDDPRHACMVAEYFRSRREWLHDPRQHSIGLTYVVQLTGEPAPAGEALEFKWFELDQLPMPDEFGFDQHHVVATCLSTMRQT